MRTKTPDDMVKLAESVSRSAWLICTDLRSMAARVKAQSEMTEMHLPLCKVADAASDWIGKIEEAEFGHHPEWQALKGALDELKQYAPTKAAEEK